MTKEYMIKDIVEYLRHREREYREDKTDLGGVAFLYEMVQRGDIKMDMMLQILPAVQSPYRQYEIEIIDNGK